MQYLLYKNKFGTGSSRSDGSNDQAETSNFQSVSDDMNFTIAGWVNIQVLQTDDSFFSFDNGAINVYISGNDFFLTTNGYGDNTLTSNPNANTNDW